MGPNDFELALHGLAEVNAGDQGILLMRPSGPSGLHLDFCRAGQEFHFDRRENLGPAGVTGARELEKELPLAPLQGQNLQFHLETSHLNAGPSRRRNFVLCPVNLPYQGEEEIAKLNPGSGERCRPGRVWRRKAFRSAPGERQVRGSGTDDAEESTQGYKE